MVPCSVGLLIAQPSGAMQQTAEPSPDISVVVPSYDLLRDTLFLLDSMYLEVRIDQQMIYQHFQNGKSKKFPCSTGNRALKEGIATREGIFTIKWKSRRYMSRRFETWLNYWMPFDGGIGFHGLDGRSYYKYLGRRPSSHGCVRVSNETGRDLFRTSPNGTVVFVHSGRPARLVCFASPGDTTLRLVSEDDRELLTARLEAVHNCQVDHPALRERLAIENGEAPAFSIAVGTATGAMRVQYSLTPRSIPMLTISPAAEQTASVATHLLFRPWPSPVAENL